MYLLFVVSLYKSWIINNIIYISEKGFFYIILFLIELNFLTKYLLLIIDVSISIKNDYI